MKAVVLAGGRGKRLGEMGQHTPKPLLVIRGRTLLEWTIDSLRREPSVDEVVVLVGPNKRVADFAQHTHFSVPVMIHGVDGGLFEELKSIESWLRGSSFVVLCSDNPIFTPLPTVSLCPVSLEALLAVAPLNFGEHGTVARINNGEVLLIDEGCRDESFGSHVLLGKQVFSETTLDFILSQTWPSNAGIGLLVERMFYNNSKLLPFEVAQQDYLHITTANDWYRYDSQSDLTY